MDRFAELSEKIKAHGQGGYFKLKKEEREEYDKIKQEYQKQPTDFVSSVAMSSKELAYTPVIDVKDQTIATKKGKTIELANHFEKGKENWWALDWQFQRKAFNEKTREVDLIHKIKYLKPDNTVVEEEMNLLAFFKNSPRVKFDVIEEKSIPIIKDMGAFSRSSYSNKDLVRKEGARMTVTTQITIFKVKLPDGRIIEIDDKHVNP